MGWTQSLGLNRLVRLARGDAGIANDSAWPASRSAEDKARDLLARRRADLHPDAPPRAPLVASRDLPQIVELKLVETDGNAIPCPEARIAAATLIRDTTDRDRPRPLPRAPQPLSDSDLSWVRDLLAEREGGKASPERAPEARPSIADDARDTPLMALLDRFEQGVAHRVVLRDSEDARHRLAGSVVPPAVDVPVTVEPTNDIAMDSALDAALATLRNLSAKANGR